MANVQDIIEALQQINSKKQDDSDKGNQNIFIFIGNNEKALES